MTGEPEIEYQYGDVWYADPTCPPEDLAKMARRRTEYGEVYERMIASGALKPFSWNMLRPPPETHDYEFHNDYGKPDPNTVQAGDPIFRCE